MRGALTIAAFFVTLPFAGAAGFFSARRFVVREREWKAMTLDPIRARRELAPKRRLDKGALAVFFLVFAGSLMVYLRETGYEFVDFWVHTRIAGEFDFRDLHSITSRLAYPMWHLLVAVLFQLGVPLRWAAAGVSAACKACTFWLVYELITAMSGGQARRWVVTLLSTAVVMVTAIRIPSVSLFVYKGVGSPNVWHNPTQQAVTLAMMLVMPWLAHCWYEFERALDAGESRFLLPWWKVAVLAVLCMGSLACKPTFMQALLPAAFVMYLVELIRHRDQWRYFGQIVLAFVPSAAYFLLQYLYYTGVVVEYTSGVEIGVTLEGAWAALRNTLMMSAAPLAAVVVCRRKGLFKDRQIVLALLMTLFSVLEAMFFHETGLRTGHGNFAWAAGSSSFYLWAVMCGVTLRCIAQDRKSGAMTLARRAGYGACAALFLWHVASGVYYLYYLLTTQNAF